MFDVVNIHPMTLIIYRKNSNKGEFRFYLNDMYRI